MVEGIFETMREGMQSIEATITAGSATPLLVTPRLELFPMSLALVEAVMANRRGDVERMARARLASVWPGRALVERAFSASLERIRENPGERLWGDRLMICRDGERRIVGSVVFHGRPGPDGVAEVAYGVEIDSQGSGYATEATRASVEWALGERGVRSVTATTLPWHRASIRVLEKVGMRAVGSREHETLGELVVYERRAE